MDIDRRNKMHESGHKMLKLCLWILGAIGTIVTAYVGWSGSTLYSLGATVATVAERMETYNNEVTALRGDLRNFVENQYTKQQAESDQRLIYKNIEILSHRIDRLEK